MYSDITAERYVKRIPLWSTNQEESFYKSLDPSKIRETGSMKNATYDASTTIVIEPIYY
jgi:hypothetical protein